MKECIMAKTTEHDAAAGLAKQIEALLTENAKLDQEKYPPDERPPAFVDAVMPDKPVKFEQAADLDLGDWELISKALEHYAACSNSSSS